MLAYIGSLEDFLPALEVSVQCREEERLAETPWTGEKIAISLMDHPIQVFRLIDIYITIRAEFLEPLHAYRIFHWSLFHNITLQA